MLAIGCQLLLNGLYRNHLAIVCWLPNRPYLDLTPKRHDNLRRHYKLRHPERMSECATIQKGPVEERRGGISMPVAVKRSLLSGRWGLSSQADSPAPATVSRPPASPPGDAVISLSPCPISPLVARTSPIIHVSG